MGPVCGPEDNPVAVELAAEHLDLGNEEPDPGIASRGEALTEKM
jgi:hypothetical protein